LQCSYASGSSPQREQTQKQIIYMTTKAKNCPYAKKLRFEAKMQMIAVSTFLTITILLTLIIS
jgi:hypothetical protein